MQNIETPKAFPLTFEYAEGDAFTNEILKDRRIYNIVELRTLLTMLEGDAPEAGHGYRKVWFKTRGYALCISLNSDCSESQSHVCNTIDEQVGLE